MKQLYLTDSLGCRHFREPNQILQPSHHWQEFLSEKKKNSNKINTVKLASKPTYLRNKRNAAFASIQNAFSNFCPTIKSSSSVSASSPFIQEISLFYVTVRISFFCSPKLSCVVLLLTLLSSMHKGKPVRLCGPYRPASPYNVVNSLYVTSMLMARWCVLARVL